jgi:hypothetical protein
MGITQFDDTPEEGEDVTTEKKGIFSWFKGKQFAQKPDKGVAPIETGKVKEVDVTSNKFVVPDREQKPLPDQTYPYKPKRTGRYIRVSQ